MGCKAQERPGLRFLRLRTEFEQASSPVINTFLICVLLQRTKMLAMRIDASKIPLLHCNKLFVAWQRFFPLLCF